MEIDATLLIEKVLDKTLGLSVYHNIQSLYSKCDVSSSIQFQRLFTFFYRVRCSKEWRDGYFRIFQSLREKGKLLDIGTILYALCKMSNESRIDLSFASKMLHTINPDMPIWDSVVRSNLQMNDVPTKGSPGRIEAAISIYEDLTEKMQSLLETENVKNQIRLFDRFIPQYRSISQMKKLDFLIWGYK